MAVFVFQCKKLLPYLAFPVGVCDCEGASRFPWASSLLWGGKTRTTGLLGRLSGWPSAVFSLLPPFAAQPRWGGACQGWGAAPPGAQRRALALTPESPLAVYCEAFPRREESRRGPVAGRATPLSVVRGRLLRGSPGRHSGAATAPAGWRSHPYRQERQRAAKPLGDGGTHTVGHATSAVSRTGATAGEASRVLAVPGQALLEVPVRWQAAGQAS